MSANATIATAIPVRKDPERGHRTRVLLGYLVSATLIAGIFIYGFNYYTLDSTERPFSPKHVLLKPSGSVGVKLGFLGLAMFLVIFLYPLRKRWAWLSRQGSAKHWLDYHVILGISAPFIIALHSSFKFHGFAGMAFWIMLAVSLSGVIGRYLYSQIPRSLNTAELTIRELREVQESLAQQLQAQRLLPEAELSSLLKLPAKEQVEGMWMLNALVYMIALDVTRWFRIARLRRHLLTGSETLSTLGGMLPTRHPDLEKAIATAREEAATAKRVLFLSRARQVFHLWHVVHKPFSYTFAVLALFHIGVVIALGFM
ncbi:MAG TPA: hypothetical protein VFA68_22140 [Terriglobales bacterium]|nr:hypothetical protein [Terriglobales bacterium]